MGLMWSLMGGAPLGATSTAILETTTKCGAVWRVWRSPRTRERRAEWRVGGSRACESFGLGILHAVGLSVSVQHHCGVEPRTVVALQCGGVFSFFSSDGLRSWVSILA
jgi:hypothetical protein